MNLDIYGVKDTVEGGFVFFYEAANDGVMKRIIKSAMLSKEPNVFTTNLKDKDILKLGNVDTDTGIITNCIPIFICNLSQVRLELIDEVKRAKVEVGEAKPDANEVCKDE